MCRPLSPSLANGTRSVPATFRKTYSAHSDLDFETSPHLTRVLRRSNGQRIYFGYEEACNVWIHFDGIADIASSCQQVVYDVTVDVGQPMISTGVAIG